ncbi:diphthine--ammonia ligase [Planctomycetota bacterium]
MRVVVSWSGGKDSCLACYKAMSDGLDVSWLFNAVTEDGQRSRSHGLSAALLAAQAEAAGIPLVQVSISRGSYEAVFKETINDLKQDGAEGMVFGDINLQEHKDWVERVCREIGIEPFEPLWEIQPDEVVNEFISLGFETVIVSCKADALDKKYLGRYMDKELVKELKGIGVCPCGENGEFHTFVVNGPIFKKKLEIVKSRQVFRKEYSDHWFLEIEEFKIS